MYYKLTMRDKRVVFVPVEDFRKTLRKNFPDVVDWEMVEGNTAMEATQFDMYNDWADKDTKAALDEMGREGMVSEE